MITSPSENIDILLKAFEHSNTQDAQLRERVMAVHTWIGSIQIAIIGGIIALGPGKLDAFGLGAKLSLMVAILSLFLFAWTTEVLTFRSRVAEQKASVRIIRLLHLFDSNYFGEHEPIFDESDWTDWTDSPLRRAGISPSTAVLAVLAFVAAVLIWTV
jgi:hypothetical protein